MEINNSISSPKASKLNNGTFKRKVIEFKPKKEQKVAELMTLVDEWLEKLLEKPVGDVNNSVDEYEKYTQSAYSAVIGYFDDSINPNHLSIKDFFKQEIEQFNKGLTLI